VYEFYDHTFIESIGDIASRTPAGTSSTTTISIASLTATDSFALRFSGYILAPETGVYTLFTTSDDGSGLFIDGKKVVDNDGNHGQEEKSGDVLLSAGLHTMTVLYFNQTRGQGITARWQGPGIAKTIIPDSALFYGTGTTVSRQGGFGRLDRAEKKQCGIRFVKNGFAVSVNSHEPWTLDLYNLNGAKIHRFCGVGSGIAGNVSQLSLSGFVIARLKTAHEGFVNKKLVRVD
jgi:hypothetical protein